MEHELGIETINRQRLSDAVKQRLMELIVDQSLKPGDSLPSEGELADRFGVSKPTIREAMRFLSGIGVIEIAQGKLATVRSPSSEPLETFFQFAISSTGNGLQEAIELRRKLETEIAVLAAERATDRQVAELEAALGEMKASLGTLEPWVDADVRFHIALAKSAQNSLMLYLVEALSSLFRESIRALHVHRGPKGVEGTLARHVSVFEAVRAGDSAAARQAMQVHFDATEPFLHHLHDLE